MEALVMSDTWWQGRRVFVTGHTGFMGGWLCSYLLSKGAIVSGYALAPVTDPSFFHAVSLGKRLNASIIGDVRDLDTLSAAMSDARPEVIFHLAAQPLVLRANAEPIETFETNVMGTVNVMEAARHQNDLSAMLLVTTDKVYQNNNWHWPYRESDPLGGKEPYSASKAASEHVITAYANSYFPDLGIAALRVGNIIGGGDWADNRLLPDAIRSFAKAEPLTLRNPRAVRPWQHVLDPLPGYLQLAQALAEKGTAFSGGWNFGPVASDCQPVAIVARQMAQAWGDGASVQVEETSHIFEEKLLSLDSAKAHAELGWSPTWSLSDGILALVDWYKSHSEGADMWAYTQAQITKFEERRT
ncbi:CDP-glucose 4,6-dehydratase [Loktanella sp. S4079]|uniref:CDP-glucose 4,6-dehydratase n=1 Tax=Loktanella sp. S4079 TaxID=579483 RepID=UPI0005F9E598|nr:CDP-glucose 4,6-dehydratase [Loktanella sp. S4079]KJZ18640.1 CDP-glucose 4,6-dehydratase [Loktanella sp. S4079]